MWDPSTQRRCAPNGYRAQDTAAAAGHAHQPVQAVPAGAAAARPRAGGVARPVRGQIGRASCRERVEISVVAVSLKKKIRQLRANATKCYLVLVKARTKCRT